MTRILDDANEILYFTEEHGADNGIHARDSQGRYYSILEGIDYNDETTGLGKVSTVSSIYDINSLFCPNSVEWRKANNVFAALSPLENVSAYF